MPKKALPFRTAGRPPRGANPEAREHLLDAAIQQFAQRGIANTTVADVAAAGKVTSAMVHYWFDTREKLLDAVVDERLVKVIQRMWEPGQAEHANAIDLVQALLQRMLEITAELPWLASLWLREIVQEGGLLRERVLKRIPRERNVPFHRRILEAQARGEVNPQIIPELLFFSMLALVMLPQSGSKSWPRFNTDITAFDRSKLEGHVTALLLHGLTGAPARKTRPRSGE